MDHPQKPSENAGENPETPDPDIENAAAIAAAFLDLWQRSMAALTTDPRSGPDLGMVEQLAADWLRKPPGGGP